MKQVDLLALAAEMVLLGHAHRDVVLVRLGIGLESRQARNLKEAAADIASCVEPELVAFVREAVP